MPNREYVIRCLKYLHDRETWKEGPLVWDDHAADRTVGILTSKSMVNIPFGAVGLSDARTATRSAQHGTSRARLSGRGTGRAGGDCGMMYIDYRMTDAAAEALISFIKNHEREEIPDDVWDICMELIDLTERW